MEYNSNYRGIVTYNNDPENKGFVKVFVPGIHPDEFFHDPKALPWCEPAMPIFGGSGPSGLGRNPETGITSVPHVNAGVWVFFERGDVNFPIYTFAVQGGTGWMSKYKNQHVIRTDNVNITINEPNISDDLFEYTTVKETSAYVPTNKKQSDTEEVYFSNNRNILKPINVSMTSSGQFSNMIPALEIKTPQLSEVPVRLHMDVNGNYNLDILGNVNIRYIGTVYEEVIGDKYTTHNGDHYHTHNGNTYSYVNGDSVVNNIGNIETKIVGNIATHINGSNVIQITGSDFKSVLNTSLLEATVMRIENSTTKFKTVYKAETNSITGSRYTNVTGIETKQVTVSQNNIIGMRNTTILGNDISSSGMVIARSLTSVTNFATGIYKITASNIITNG